jgi:hypothetical protein
VSHTVDPAARDDDAERRRGRLADVAAEERGARSAGHVSTRSSRGVRRPRSTPSGGSCPRGRERWPLHPSDRGARRQVAERVDERLDVIPETPTHSIAPAATSAHAVAGLSTGWMRTVRRAGPVRGEARRRR